MNSKLLLPPGYRSVQDFILHYHRNNRVNDDTQLNEQPQPSATNSKDIKRSKVLNNSPETFKKEIVMKKVPEPIPVPNQGTKRQYYERAQKSDIHPSILLKPEQMTFLPITKF